MSALEQFIRAKYERKQFMRKDADPPTRRRPKAKKSETAPPSGTKSQKSETPQNLISLAEEPAADEWNFQGASQQSSHVPTLAPPKGPSAPKQSDSGMTFGDFTAAAPSLTPQSFDAADAFFSSTPTAFPTPSTPTPSGPTASKESILQLFETPHSASFGAPLTSQSSQGRSGPNYNVSLPGLGLPAHSTYPNPMGMPNPTGMGMHNNMGMQNNMGMGMPNNMGMGMHNMGMQNNMGMYNTSMGNGGYNNLGMHNMGMARPMGTPGGPTNFVNTNGYVNAKWMSSQSGGHM